MRTATNSRILRLAPLALGFGIFAQVTSEFLPVGVLADVARDLNITVGIAGLMMTLPAILAALAASAIPLVIGERDRKSVLLCLAALLVLASLICATASSFKVLLMGRALVGFSLGATFSLSLSVTRQVVPPDQVHKAAAAVFGGVTAAMVFGLPLGTLISEAASWRYAFAAGGGLGVMMLALQALILPSIPASGTFRFSDYGTFLSSKGTVLSIFLILVGHAAHFGAYTFVGPALRQAGVSADRLTLIFLAFGVIGFIANYRIASWAKRSTFAALVSMLTLLSIATLMIALNDSAHLRLAAMAVWGVAWGGLPLSLNLWHRNIPGGGGEAGSGIFMLCAQIAIATGSGLGGVLTDRVGLSNNYLVWATLAGAAALLFYRSRRRA